MPKWDVRDKSGAIVTDVKGLAEALDTTPEEAVRQLLSNVTLTAAAPTALLADVKAAARPKPGDGTPPPISTGSFVSFRGGKGKVDMIVKKGKVPGVKDDVEATSDSPAARVVVWKDGKATPEKRGFSTHTLKRIAPLDGDGKKSATDPASALVALVASHDRHVSSVGLPEHARVTGLSVKTAYDRGIDAYPVGRTTLTRTEWALGRAEHFVKVAAGTETKGGNDVDLLHPDHPLRSQAKVYVNHDDLDATVRALLDAAK